MAKFDHLCPTQQTETTHNFQLHYLHPFACLYLTLAPFLAQATLIFVSCVISPLKCLDLALPVSPEVFSSSKEPL